MKRKLAIAMIILLIFSLPMNNVPFIIAKADGSNLQQDDEASSDDREKKEAKMETEEDDEKDNNANKTEEKEKAGTNENNENDRMNDAEKKSNQKTTEKKKDNTHSDKDKESDEKAKKQKKDSTHSDDGKKVKEKSKTERKKGGEKTEQNGKNKESKKLKKMETKSVSGDYEYMDHGDGTATITNYTGNEMSIVVPSELDGLTIIEIGENAFPFNLMLFSVEIPNSVLSIRNDAFSSMHLKTAIIHNPSITIAENAFNSIILKIIGQNPSTAKTYADANNNYTFKEVDSEPEMDYEWTKDESGVTITKYVGTEKDIDMPNQIDGSTVTRIADWVFVGKQLTSVTLPDGLKSIGNTAFYHNQLSSITFPEGLISIGNNAFQDNDLTSIEIPDSVNHIGTVAFYKNQITSVKLPKSLTSIPRGAFNTNKIKEIHLPDSLTHIGEGAFLGNELEGITIPGNVKRIESSAFSLNKLKNIVIPESVIFIGEFAFSRNQLEHVAIQNPSVNIEKNAFANNLGYPHRLTMKGEDPSTAKDYAEENDHTFISMDEDDYEWTDHGDGTAAITKYVGTDKDVKIPNSLGGLTVTSIGERAFFDMQLVHITIPDSVTEIGERAFSSNELTAVIIPNSVIDIGEYAFSSNDIKRVIVPDNVEHIGYAAFAYNPLIKVEMQNKDTIIGKYAFPNNGADLEMVGYDPSTAKDYADENNFTFYPINHPPENEYEWMDNKDGTATITAYKGTDKHVKIPLLIDGLKITIIGENVFYDHQLTDVEFNGYITNVKQGAFGKNQFTSITIPHSIIHIGDRAFADNKLLTTIAIMNPDTTIGENAFQGNQQNPADVTIFGYKLSDANTYASEEGFTFKDITTVIKYNYEWTDNGDGTAAITKYTGLAKEVTIPETVGEGLTVTEIGRLAFGVSYDPEDRDKKLDSVVIPDSVTKIDEGAFRNNNLASVRIPDSVMTIGREAFDGNRMTELDLGNGVKYIKERAFAYHDLKNIVIPDSVLHIGDNAFDFGGTITSLELGNSVEYIGAAAFNGNKLTHLIIPESVETVGNLAFFSYGRDLTRVEVQNKDTIFKTDGNFGSYFGDSKDVTIIGYNPSTSRELAKKYNYKFGHIYAPDYDLLIHDDRTVTILDYIGTAKDVVIPKTVGDGLTVTEIGRFAFGVSYDPDDRNKKLDSVVIPDSVTKIGEGAFQNNNLSSVEIPDSVISIGKESFDANRMTDLDLGNGVQYIKERAFAYHDLNNIVIPDSVLHIGDNAFGFGGTISSLELGNSVEYIGAEAFNGNQLTHLIIPESVETVGNLAFFSYGRDLTRVEVQNKDTIFKTDGNFGSYFGDSKDVTIIGYDPSTAKDLAGKYGYAFMNGEGTVNFSPNKGTDRAKSYATKVEVSGYDNSKDLEYVWSTSSNTPSSGWLPLLNETNVNTPIGTGEHYLHVRGTSMLGSLFTSHSDAFSIDNTAPDVTITPSTKEPTHEDVKLKVKGFDEHSGLKRIQDPNGHWHEQDEFKYIVTTNGTYTFIAEDNAGNTKTESITVGNIDKTISIEVPTIPSMGNITLSDQPTIHTTDLSSAIVKDWREGDNDWRLDVSAKKLKMVDADYSLPAGSVTLQPLSNIQGNGSNLPVILTTEAQAIDNGKITIAKANDSRGEFALTFPDAALEILIDPTTTIVNDPNGTTYETTITWELVTAP